MAAAARAAGIADLDGIHAEDPTRDVEVASHSQYRHRASMSRASLPLSHRRSFSTVGGRPRADSTGRRPSTAYGERNEDDLEANELGAQDAEIPWGPAHPCFPHLNPHVPQSSPLYEKTRVIRIKRDWMLAGDLAPTFSRVYPEILEPYLSEEKFRELIDHVNETLIRAHDPWRPRAWVDAALGLLTAWVYDDLGLSGMKAEIKALETWIERWNEMQGAKDRVKVIQLRRTAFLSLDLQIPDPQIGTDAGPDAASFMDGGSTMGADSRYSRAASNVGPMASSIYSAGLATDASQVPQADEPAVPQIPGKYLDEAREAVGRQLQKDAA